MTKSVERGIRQRNREIRERRAAIPRYLAHRQALFLSLSVSRARARFPVRPREIAPFSIDRTRARRDIARREYRSENPGRSLSSAPLERLPYHRGFICFLLFPPPPSNLIRSVRHCRRDNNVSPAFSTRPSALETFTVDRCHVLARVRPVTCQPPVRTNYALQRTCVTSRIMRGKFQRTIIISADTAPPVYAPLTES